MMSSISQLSGRKRFFTELQRRIKQSQKKNDILGLIIIRLIQLRDINDEFGYEFADSVLQEVHDRIQILLDSSNLITRIGDKEFAVIVSHLKSEGQSVLLANHIIELFNEPLKINGRLIKIRLAIGIAHFPENSQEPSGLMICAERAISSAVNADNKCVVFSDVNEGNDTTMFAMESELDEAINNDQIDFYYQPKINLRDMTISGFEVLSRWNNVIRGPVRPDIFIDVAEKTDLITSLSVQCMARTLQQIKELPANNNYSIAINLSLKY